MSDASSSQLFVFSIILRCVEIRGALEGVSNARADVFRAHVAFEFGLLHELGGLFAGAAEQQRTA